MATFGDEFINVQLEFGVDVRNREVFRQRLANFIAGLTPRRGDARGWILYFAPDTYVLSRITTTTEADRNPVMPPVIGTRRVDLWIPPDVRLMFAPNAILQLENDFILQIDGGIDAAVQQIFRIVRPEGGRGPATVLLTSEIISEVYPEWFGAVSNPENTRLEIFDSTIALEACFRAAHRDRIVRRFNDSPGERVQRSSIPVQMSGPYVISRGLTLGEPCPWVTGQPRNAVGCVVRGREGVGSIGIGDFTFIPPQDVPFTGSAMLTVDGVHGCVLDGLGFWGENETAVRVGLQIKVTTPAGGPEIGDARMTRVRRCVFARLAEAHLVLGDQPLWFTRNDTWVMEPEGMGPAMVAGGLVDLSGALIEQCVFEVRMGDGTAATERRPGPLRPCAILFRAANSVPAVIRDCTFGGLASAFILAFGGRLHVEGCTFHNSKTPAPEPSDATLRERIANWPLGGSDIFLADPVTATAPTTGLTVLEAESQSYQFLGTFRRRGRASGRVLYYNVVLESVRHGSVEPEPRPPAVDWWGPGLTPVSGNRAGELVLLGVTVRGGPDAMPGLSGRVRVQTGVSRVVDVGTKVEHGPEQVAHEAIVISEGSPPRLRFPNATDTGTNGWLKRMRP